MLQLQRFPGESDASLVELRRVQGSVAHIIRAEFGKGAEEGGRARPTVRPHDEGIVFRVAFRLEVEVVFIHCRRIVLAPHLDAACVLRCEKIRRSVAREIVESTRSHPGICMAVYS